jgi:glutathione S-transferase
MKPTLQLHYYPSNASMAPHMVLQELGVPFELKLVDRTNDAHPQAGLAPAVATPERAHFYDTVGRGGWANASARSTRTR